MRRVITMAAAGAGAMFGIATVRFFFGVEAAAGAALGIGYCLGVLHASSETEGRGDG